FGFLGVSEFLSRNQAVGSISSYASLGELTCQCFLAAHTQRLVVADDQSDDLLVGEGEILDAGRRPDIDQFGSCSGFGAGKQQYDSCKHPTFHVSLEYLLGSPAPQLLRIVWLRHGDGTTLSFWTWLERRGLPGIGIARGAGRCSTMPPLPQQLQYPSQKPQHQAKLSRSKVPGTWSLDILLEWSRKSPLPPFCC